MVVKQYLRYVKDGQCFANIASGSAPLQFIKLEQVSDRFVACASCEDVIVWDTKTDTKKLTIKGELSHVSTFKFNWDNEPVVGIGYTDGTISVFNYETQEKKCSFVGHKSAPTSICFAPGGLQMASGGKDCEIVIWDIVNESGLFRLRGHKHAITKLSFMKTHENILISASKDTLVKFWDLRTQHCFKTLFGHKSEVWDFVLYKDDKRIITGSNDIRVFKIVFNDSENPESDTEEIDEGPLFDDEEENRVLEEEESENLLKVKYMGNVLRASTTRLVGLDIDSTERVLTCNGNDTFVECFKLRSREEIRAHFQKKIRKLKRKLEHNSAHDNNETDSLKHVKVGLRDELERLDPVKGSSTVRFVNVVFLKNSFKIALLLNNNAFELHSYDLKDQAINKLLSIEKHAHRSMIQAIAVSSDNHVILSASKDSVKVWNRATRSCFATVSKIEPPTCVLFAPGDRFALIGTKKGNIQVLNLGSSEIVETIKVSLNGEPVTSIYAYPNEKGLVSGSEDKKVRFWDFDIVKDDYGKRLTLTIDREMDVDDGVVCVRISQDMKLLAVSLLDSTVRIFYFDSLRFFLSLYGHKFPVTCMDISTDGTIIATGSPDKNIKIWGLDFGDCHKSIFAHDECINDLRFCEDSHYFFTCSRDHTIKQWDGDSFQKIMTLKGHEADVNALNLTQDGKFLISVGKDHSMRIWKKTDEILVIEDELETEKEIEYEKEAFRNEENVVPGETNKETGLPSYKTSETARATEKLIEAIDIFNAEIIKLEEYQQALEKSKKEKTEEPVKPAVNILFNLYKTDCPFRYMIEVLRSIKSSELEECLLCLPFNYVVQIIKILGKLFEKNWETELLCRVVCFLTRLHIGQIIANHTLASEIKKLRDITISKAVGLRDLAGYNLAALQYVHSKTLAEDELSLFNEAYSRGKEKKKKNKKSDSIYTISIR